MELKLEKKGHEQINKEKNASVKIIMSAIQKKNRVRDRKWGKGEDRLD